MKLSKTLSMSLGFLFLGLGFVGLFLPVVPTTPFLLCSAYFFSRHSEKLHRWLLGLPRLGNLISEWERTRSVKKSVKVYALTMIFVCIGGSYYLLLNQSLYLRGLLLVLGAVGVFVVSRLKVSSPRS